MSPKTRSPLTVEITERDAWGVQMHLKFNMVMLDPTDQEPIFSKGVIPFLRVKINHALLRFAHERPLSTITLPLSYEECWVIDWVISVSSWPEVDRFLTQIFAVMAEHEMGGLHLRSAEDGDTKWDKGTETDFAEWVAQQQVDRGNNGGAGV